MARITQEDPWAKIPHWVVIHPDLDATSIRVYLVLSKHANNQTHNSYPGMRRIAEESYLSTATVQKAIAQLEAVGAVVVTRNRHATVGGRRQVNHYHLPFSRVSKSDTPPGPTIDTPVSTIATQGGPISDTELDPFLTSFMELEDLLRIQEQNPIQEGESKSAYSTRIRGLYQ